MLVTVVDDHRFRAMGTDCHVQVVGGPAGTPDLAEALVRSDEARWSRFLPGSELRRLHTGAPEHVSPETAELVALALGWRGRTGGRFDPLLGRQLRAAGYDRSFEHLCDAGPVAAADPGPPAAGAVVVDGDRVTVPPGVELDLGGIAKGHSADRAAAALLAAGAAGACVNLGGDLRCVGESPTGDGWWTALDHGPDAEASRFAVGLLHGAIATSTTSRRRWTTATGAEHHHLLDPRTGRPAEVRWPTATVIAPSAATAEVLAKVVLLADPAESASLLGAHGAVAMATDHDGALHRLGDVDPLLAPLAALPAPHPTTDHRSAPPWT
ncbi:MAG TPA: FAD:protein FMN transferase [Acidimicrobiales bacterium]|nr:FAD:protein FMN transferase [Acidimicrobiales bacterium]